MEQDNNAVYGAFANLRYGATAGSGDGASRLLGSENGKDPAYVGAFNRLNGLKPGQGLIEGNDYTLPNQADIQPGDRSNGLLQFGKDNARIAAQYDTPATPNPWPTPPGFVNGGSSQASGSQYSPYANVLNPNADFSGLKMALDSALAKYDPNADPNALTVSALKPPSQMELAQRADTQHQVDGWNLFFCVEGMVGAGTAAYSPSFQLSSSGVGGDYARGSRLEPYAGYTASETWTFGTGATSNGAATGPVPKNYGVAFFGEDNFNSFYSSGNVLVGAPGGKPFYFMPLEDSAIVTDSGSAARYTGMAKSATKAYVSGGDIYGFSFPTEGMDVRLPTAADAGGWPHFLEGGQTAVLGTGPNAGYLVNPTREFVVPGGSPAPTGSVVFKLGPNGEWIPIRKF